MPVQKPLLGQRAVATAWKTLTSEVINLMGMWTHLHLASSHYAAHHRTWSWSRSLAWSSGPHSQLHLGVDSPEGVWAPCVSPGPWAGCPHIGPLKAAPNIGTCLLGLLLWPQRAQSYVGRRGHRSIRRASISKAPEAAALHGVAASEAHGLVQSRAWLGCSCREGGLEASEG